LDLANDIAGSFAEQFTGTLSNGGATFLTGTPVTLSESCTQSVVDGTAGLIKLHQFRD